MPETVEITALELRRLLVKIKNKRPDMCVRFRLLGKMWFLHFMKIILITETGVILNDEISNKMFLIQDLSTVMQFEIDHRFQNYQPHFHYKVNILRNWHKRLRTFGACIFYTLWSTIFFKNRMNITMLTFPTFIFDFSKPLNSISKD